MGIQIKIGMLGQEGIFPELVFIQTPDSFATATTPGYLTQLQNQGYTFNNDQMAFLNANDQNALVSVSVVDGEVSLTYPVGEVNSVFGRAGIVVAQTGDYNTSQVTESGNLYFTQSRVLGTPLTGLSLSNSPINSSDSILSAFGKTQGQINAIVGSEVISVFGRTGAVVANTGDYTAAQVTNAADKSSSSIQVFNGNIQTPLLFAGISPNIYPGSQIANLLLINNPSIPAQQLNIGWDSTNTVAFLQSIYQGTSARPLMFQNSGGNIGFGYPNTHVFTRMYEFNGSSLFSDTIFANNGINVSDSGGGIQFNDTGTMDINTGISFFSSDQYYRMGFDSQGGTVGWIRSNVDAADSIHGFIWSAGVTSNPLNALMYLRGDGKLLLGANANTLTGQSLANIYGDLFLGNISTPSTPGSGGKLYSKLTSGNSDLYYLDSNGLEHQLTNSSSGLVTSVFGRTGAIVAVNTDYNTVNYFQTTSQIMRADTSVVGTHFQITGATDTSMALNFGVYTSQTPSFVYFDSVSGGNPAEIKFQAMDGMNGSVSIGLSISIPAQALLDVDGAISLAQLSTPSTPRSGSGMIYPKSDHNLYYLSDLGVEERINPGSAGPVISVFSRTGIVTAQTGDYTQNQVTNLTTSSSPVFSGIFLQQDSSSGNQLVISGLTNTDPNISLGYDSTDGVGVLQCKDHIANRRIHMQPDGGQFAFNYARNVSAFQANFNIGGNASFSDFVLLLNTSTPSTPTGGGSIYSKSVSGNSRLFFLDSSGVENDLTPSGIFNIVTVNTSTYTNTGLEDVLSVDASSSAVSITINTSLLKKELRIYKKNPTLGSFNITVTPSAGQTINNSSSGITIFPNYSTYSYIRIVPSDSSTLAYLSDISISIPATPGCDWRPSGIQYQWSNSTISSIAPLSSQQVTLSWPSAFPTAIFDAYPSIVEGTTGVALTVKKISQSASNTVIEVTNLNATTTVTGVRVSAFANGN